MFGQIEFQRKRFLLAVHHWEIASIELDSSENNDILFKGRLQYKVGQAKSKMGLVLEATEIFQESLSNYKLADNLQHMGKLYMEMAKSYKKAGDLQKTVDFTERAISVFELVNNQLLKANLELDCAVSIADRGNLDEVKERVESIICTFQQMGRSEEVGIASVEMAKILLKKGEIDLAEEFCLKARALVPELMYTQLGYIGLLVKLHLNESR